MSIALDLRQKRQERKSVLDAAGAILNRASREKRSLTSDESQEFERRHSDGDSILADIARLEKQLDVAMKMDAPARDTRTAGREDIVRETRQHSGGATRTAEGLSDEQCDVTTRWLAGGPAALTQEETRGYMRGFSPDEQRALSAVTGNLGGFTSPQGFVYTLDTAMKYYGGIIEAASYIDTDNGILLPYPSMNDTSNTAEVIAENTAVAGATAGEVDPAYGVVNFNAYMFDSKIVKVPIQLLQDSAFDVGVYLDEQLNTRIGRSLNTKCTVGSGANEPTGIITAASVGITGGSQTNITYSELLDVEYSVDKAYRPKAKWMFHDLSMKKVRQLVDSNGRPLFIAGGVSEGIQGRAPDTLMGYPIVISNDMATMASAAKSIVFGDLSKYKIRRVKQLQMVRFGERYMDSLQIGFLAFQRFDGNLIDAGVSPVKVFKNAT